VKDLIVLGELSVEGGRGAVGRYELRMTSVDITDVRRQKLPTPAATSVKTTDPPRRQKLPTLPEEPQVKASSVKTTEVAIPDALDLGSVVSGERPRAKRVSDAPRPDVDRLCGHLADQIEANGSKRPEINQRWRTAARLLLDADKRTEEDVHKAIDWCQKHHFWHRNILSMEKLRQQYDRLRLDAKAELEKKARPSANSHQPTADEFAQLRANWARPLDALEAGNDPR
jgi:hypothetical protein